MGSPRSGSKLRLAIIGARGIANYGGFESYVAELAPRLAARGLGVTCSCERDREDPVRSYKGAELRYFPFRPPRNYALRKLFEIIYDIYFVLRCDYDVIYGLNCNAGLFYLLPRMMGKHAIVNIDGVDWVRTKYNRLEQFLFHVLYLLVEGTASMVAIDSRYMRRFVPPRFRHKLVYAPNGVNLSSISRSDDSQIEINGVTLKPNGFWLVVARLEPENNIGVIIQGYAESKSPLPLVIVGNFTSSKFRRNMENLVVGLGIEARVIFTGGVYDRSLLDKIRSSCYAYIHGHSVGGTNPSLLEIMCMAKIILAFDTGFNREVGGDTVLYFGSSADLARTVSEVEANYRLYSPHGNKARARVGANYDWNTIIPWYFGLFIRSSQKGLR